MDSTQYINLMNRLIKIELLCCVLLGSNIGTVLGLAAHFWKGSV